MATLPESDSTVPWWLAPHACILAILVPASLVVASYHSDYVMLADRYYTGFPLALFILGLLMLAAGSWFGSRTPLAPPARPLHVAPVYLDTLAALALAAYVIWFRDLIASPGLLMEVLGGARMNLRDDIATVPGITTLTQVGVAFSAIYGLNVTVLERVPLRHHLAFAILGAAAVLRAIAWSERLAVLEYGLPMVVWGAIILHRRYPGVVRRLTALAPLLFIFGSFAVFAGFEYFRSWIYFEGSGDSFFARMLDRWILYYYTSMNNGAALVGLNLDQIPDFHFQHVLAALYNLPAIGPVFAEAFHVDPTLHDRLLNERGLSEEFNVFTGIYPVLYDLGPVAGVMFCFALGWGLGALYGGLRSGRAPGIVIFPTMFVAILEIIRIDYLFTTRYVYAAVACITAWRWFLRDTETTNSRVHVSEA
jgi:hypothetical protein